MNSSSVTGIVDSILYKTIEQSIHYTISSGARVPISICALEWSGTPIVQWPEYGYQWNANLRYVKVCYDDGTEEEYEVSISHSDIYSQSCPGIIEYVRSDRYGDWDRYYFIYTENGVSTPETVLYSYYDD